MISTKLHGLCLMSSCQRRMSSHASLQAPVEPGRANRYVPPATPAVARDWMVEVPIFSYRRHGGRSTTNLGSAFRMYWGAYRLWRERA